MSADQLVPMSVGDILNEALRAYRTRFPTLLALVALFVLPFQVLSAVITVSSAGGRHASLANFASLLFLALTGQLASAACLRAVSDSYRGEASDWRSCVEVVWRRAPAVLAVALTTAMLVGIGFVLLVLPALYLEVVLLVATPALLVENLSPLGALRRSFFLVQGHWWRTFGAFVLAALFVALVALIPTEVALHLLGPGRSATTSSLTTGIVSVVTSLFTVPFMAAVVVLLYYDLRLRKEGSTDGRDRWAGADPPYPRLP